MAFSTFRGMQATGLPNPVFWLDAGNSASVSGTSAAAWLNLAVSPADGSSQGDYDADRITDPTPNYNSAGTLSYWGPTGGTGYFDITPNTTFLNSLHKDNALGTLVFVYFISSVSSSEVQYLMGSAGTSGSNTGIRVFLDASRQINFVVRNAGADALNVVSSSVASITAGVVCMVAVSVDEANGTGLFYYRNASQGTITQAFTSTYSSPSSSNATYTTNLMAAGNGETPIPAHASNEHRMYQVLGYNQALDTGQLNKVYSQAFIQARYGI